MPRWLVPMLIVVATALFVVGVALERNSNDKHVETGSSTTGGSEGSPSEGEAAHSEAEGEAPASTPVSSEAGEIENDNLLGLDVESTPFVALAAAASIALALALWLRPGWLRLLVLVAVAMIVFAGLDVREVVHQLNENKAGLAALAALVAVLHASAAGLAAMRRSAAGGLARG